MKRWYNVMTDEYYTAEEAASDRDREVVSLMPSSEQDRDLRVACLELAVTAAKNGSNFGQAVVKTAEDYRRFALDLPPEVDPVAGLSFEQRLELLVQEFLRSEIEDARKIKHGMGEVFARLDAQYPDPVEAEPEPVVTSGSAITDELLEKFRKERIVMKHTEINA